MPTPTILKEMIAVIRTEQARRASLANKDPNLTDDPDAPFFDPDTPFINELCLMVLVALRHQVERELIRLAARVRDEGKEISRDRYRANLDKVRDNLRKKDGWKTTIEATLEPDKCRDYEEIEALRLLANSYKHHPSMEPDKQLLHKLKLPTNVRYAWMPESDSLREALATFIGLNKEATYCDVAEQFIDVASSFLKEVRTRRKSQLSPISRRVSLKSSDAAR